MKLMIKLPETEGSGSGNGCHGREVADATVARFYSDASSIALIAQMSS